MKKHLFPILLAALMASCAANDPQPGDAGNGNYSEADVTGYLSVKIVNPGNIRLRDGEDNDYMNGSPQENYVSEVRFFFFDDEGQPVDIRKNPAYTEDNPNVQEYFSYYDWDPTPSDNNNYQGDSNSGYQESTPPGTLEGGTVEKIMTAMVVLTGKEGVYPTQIAAVLNPSPVVKALVNPDIRTLEGTVSDYLTGLTNNNFVMSSTAYINQDGEIVTAQPIEEKNFGLTQPAAQENPLTVYVERVVARLDMSMAITYDGTDGEALTPETLDDGTVIYPTQVSVTTEDKVYDPEDQAPEGQLEDEPIYVKFLGWAVTSTPKYSNLVKNISAGWEDSMFGTENEPWSIFQYHRSFWGMNPSTITSDAANPDASYVWYNYSQLAQMSTPIPAGCFTMDVTQTYMQENANPYSAAGTASDPEEPTKVIYAAQLVNSDGDPLTIAEWNGLYFTQQGLQNLAAKMLDMYYLEGGEYKPITGDQITFMTSSQYWGNGPIFEREHPNYYVYLTLTSQEGGDAITNAAGQTWYHLNDNVNPDAATPEDYTLISANAINAYMADVFVNAKLWNNGYTYYYYTINHLGAEDYPGFYGVVRNHIYSSTVDGLKGLGTPVYDPDEPIYPEHPSPDGNNLSAKVEILSWRLVTDSYEFEW